MTSALVFLVLAAEPLILPMPSQVLEQPLWDHAHSHTPRMQLTSRRVLPAAEVAELPVRAFDPDGDAVHILVRNLPPGATFEGATLRWNTGRVQAGFARDITFVVTDGHNYDLQTVVLQVARPGDSNRAPVIRAPRHVEMTAGYETLMEVAAHDPDNHDIRYRFITHSGELGANSKQGLPDGAGFDAATGLLSWQPSCDQGGRHHITVIAYDLALGGSMQSSHTIAIQVEEPSDAYARSVVGRWKVVAPAAKEPGVPEMLTFWPDGSVQRHETEFTDYAKRTTRDGSAIRVQELTQNYLVANDGDRELTLARCQDAQCRQLTPRACR